MTSQLKPDLGRSAHSNCTVRENERREQGGRDEWRKIERIAWNFFFNMKALAKGQSHCQGSQTCKNIHQASLRRWEHAERSPAFFFSPGSWSFF